MSVKIDTAFPIPFVEEFRRFPLDPTNPELTAKQAEDLAFNIQLLRDVMILFTACGAARGVSGHTGGPYDTVPEVCILLSIFESDPEHKKYLDTVFDEAGHRVATQYLLSALNKDLPAEHLLYYRAANSKLPGHPELGLTPGVKFSSGRLGHMWAHVNGVALSQREKVVFCLGSDGSQQEGNDAEAARLAVAQGLNVKILVDDNNVTIAGHPSDYLKGYNVGKTLEGHGLKVIRTPGEDYAKLYSAISESITTPGPVAVIAERTMAPGIPGVEGSPHAHDVVSPKNALEYLEKRGYKSEVLDVIRSIKPTTDPYLHVGSSKEKGANRVVFGEAVVGVLDKISAAEAKAKLIVIDSDLEGSTGLKVIHQKHPEVFIPSGIMERGNFAAAAGFGFGGEGRTGIFSTFSAFLEMVISEITMARLNFCDVLCHFSHSGVDEMADNTCHFGINSMFADNGLSDGYETKLYFPADPAQMTAVVEKVLFDKGIRFVFSTRAKVPWLLKYKSEERIYGPDYKFVPGVDEVIREGTDGTIVATGEMLYRVVDAVDRLADEGIKIAVINKVTVNVVDEAAIKKWGAAPFVLVVESWNQKTGLGSKLGTWLLERGLTPKYGYMGTVKEGCGGLEEQIRYQGLAPQDIMLKVKSLRS